MTSDQPFAVEALFLVAAPQQPLPPGDLLRAAVAALGSVNGKPFEPSGSRATAFLAGEGPALRISMVHPDFGNDTGYADFRLSLGAIPDHRAGIDTVMLTLHLGNPKGLIDKLWRLAIDLTARLIAELHPRTAFANGGLVDVERTILPSQKSLNHGFPAKLPPYSYFGPDVLTAAQRHALAKVTAPRSRLVDDGWELAVVESLRDPPDAGLMDEIAEIAGHEISYLGPILPGGSDA